ncbi:hypothetical protein C8Q76DRAFT_463663 [Earliella scabrosa]|nr:hypothetical protein C8Q76DRAFT_463663 [Earliella scabrosa]
MSQPTIEIAYSPATDAIKNSPHDRELVNAAFSILKAQQGCINVHWGLQHEDKETVYALIAWETLEDHKRLMENKTEYPVLNRATGSFFAGKVQMIHVKTQKEPYKAFGAPTLEIATFTLKDGESMSALESLIRELVDAVSGGAGVVDATWGPVEEKPNALVLFIGWTSVEAHWDLVKTDAKLIDIIGRGRAMATIDLIHVPLALF